MSYPHEERRAFLHLDGWGGRTTQPVIVVGQTPNRYRIRAEARTKLGGYSRYLNPGKTALVPLHAITFAPGTDNCEFCQGIKGGVKGNENVVNGVVVCDYCTVLFHRAHGTREDVSPTERDRHA